MFFEQPMPGEQAKKLGEGLLGEMGVDMEVFPKQGKSEGPGSLIRLPFGIHRKTGECYPFVHPDGRLLGNKTDQMEALMHQLLTQNLLLLLVNLILFLLTQTYLVVNYQC